MKKKSSALDYHSYISVLSRITSALEMEEKADNDRFLEECVQDPTLRDKISILGRTFQNRRMVITCIKVQFLAHIISSKHKQNILISSHTCIFTSSQNANKVLTMTDRMADSLDPDLGLHCLPRPICPIT